MARGLRPQSMWCPQRGWLWFNPQRNDYTLPHLVAGTIFNPKTRKYEMLDLITMGRLEKAWKVLVHGPPGVGKTSLAATFPTPVGADLEGSTERYEVARIDLRNAPLEAHDAGGTVDKQATSVMNFLRVLARDSHEYKTLFVDTLDWLEPKIWEATCSRLGIPSMETMGYGKAYVEADEEWEKFLGALNYLHSKRDMHIVLLAHSHTRLTNDRNFNEYQRHDIKLHKRASSKFTEWAEIIGFLTYDTYVAKKNGKEVSRHDGERVLLIHEDGQYVAKNRFGYQGEAISPVNYKRLQETLNG